jgi:hypothetical protein
VAVEGAVAVAGDGRAVGAVAPVGVVAHRRGGAPDGEGGDEVGQAAEPGRGQQARLVEDIRFGRSGRPEEGADSPRHQPPEGEDDDRLLVLYRKRPLGEAVETGPGAEYPQRRHPHLPTACQRPGDRVGGETLQGSLVVPCREQGDGAEVGSREGAAQRRGEDGVRVPQTLDILRARRRGEQAQPSPGADGCDVDGEDQREPAPFGANLVLIRMKTVPRDH